MKQQTKNNNQEWSNPSKPASQPAGQPAKNQPMANTTKEAPKK